MAEPRGPPYGLECFECKRSSPDMPCVYRFKKSPQCLINAVSDNLTGGHSQPCERIGDDSDAVASACATHRLGVQAPFQKLGFPRGAVHPNISNAHGKRCTPDRALEGVPPFRLPCGLEGIGPSDPQPGWAAAEPGRAAAGADLGNSMTQPSIISYDII